MNKKITLYELLGLVKDGKAPKEIKYNNYLLSFDDIDKDYYCEFYGNLFEYLFTNIKTTDLLNDEVEILDDEDMEIEEMKYYATNRVKNEFAIDYIENGETKHFCLNKKQRFIVDKINELVREINKLKKEGK